MSYRNLLVLVTVLAFVSEGTAQQKQEKPRSPFQNFRSTTGPSKPSGQSSKEKVATHSKWEYRVLTRREITEFGKDDFAAGLNRLGDEGWELIVVDPATPRGPIQYCFKRPKASAAQPAATGAVFNIFRLKHADASAIARTLQQVFQGKDEGTMRIVSDERTNSVLVHGTPDQMATVEAIIIRLDEEPGEKKKP